MRGKKIDNDFVYHFINNCALVGKINAKDICKEAENQIKSIDFKIKEVEELKKNRSKLNDVINTFNKKNKDNSKEKTILSFYNISNFIKAKTICEHVRNTCNYKISDVKPGEHCLVKELLLIEVLKRQEDNFVKGFIFEEFLNFLKEKFNE